MKKHQSYGILLLALLLCGSVSAKVNHYVGVNAQIGEWSLLPSKSDYTASLGVAGGLGFQYELQAGKKYSPARFLFDVGVSATGGMTAYQKGYDRTDAVPSYDLQHKPFDYMYEIKNRKDQYTDIAVQIPIMLGVQYQRFYALAGVKVYTHMFTKTASSAMITTYGKYEEWDEFRGWPEYQFFDDVPVQASVKTNLNLDMDLSLEIGARLGVINYSSGFDVPKRKMEYRIAAFMDYGILDVHTSGTKQAFDFPKYDTDPTSPTYVYKTRTMIDNLVMNDIMSTSNFAKMVNNLVVGVKFTVLFQLPEQQKCVICSDGYQSLVRSYGGSRRGMKYEE